ncbi:MAG: hypothetical protein U1D99_06095, partial [Candidatus Omnitrophota bacterium]|nr:hypothetical protein [Candidatus Omnitrophota bacterium]
LRVMKFCRRVLGSALAIAVAYGALIEVLQGNAQGREPSVIDLAINLFGGLAAVYAIRRGWLRIGEKA